MGTMDLTGPKPRSKTAKSRDRYAARGGVLRVRHATHWSGVHGAQWDALDHGASPFTRAGFLSALEDSNSVGPQTGWDPHYILAEEIVETETHLDDDRGEDANVENAGTLKTRLVGALACYRKTHSYGEYIFDWNWARASHEAGLAYYPKLVVAVPFTPATGQRILLHPELQLTQRSAVTSQLLQYLGSLADELRCQSIHALFCPYAELEAWQKAGFALRETHQFHWHNSGFTDFADYLDALRSRRRKQIHKERQRAQSQVERVQCVSGHEMDEASIRSVYSLYVDTVRAHGSMPYLRPDFFVHCAQRMGDAWQLATAYRAGRAVAGALFFEGNSALYGRYWGTQEPIENLHFEMAYYRGIERCVSRGHRLFEAGAQGEHKLLRGFVPSPTYSAHWLRHPGLANAVRQSLVHSNQENRYAMQMLAEHAQYRSDFMGAKFDWPELPAREA